MERGFQERAITRVPKTQCSGAKLVQAPRLLTAVAEGPGGPQHQVESLLPQAPASAQHKCVLGRAAEPDNLLPPLNLTHAAHDRHDRRPIARYPLRLVSMTIAPVGEVPRHLSESLTIAILFGSRGWNTERVAGTVGLDHSALQQRRDRCGSIVDAGKRLNVLGGKGGTQCPQYGRHLVFVGAKRGCDALVESFRRSPCLEFPSNVLHRGLLLNDTRASLHQLQWLPLEMSTDTCGCRALYRPQRPPEFAFHQRQRGILGKAPKRHRHPIAPEHAFSPREHECRLGKNVQQQSQLVTASTDVVYQHEGTRLLEVMADLRVGRLERDVGLAECLEQELQAVPDRLESGAMVDDPVGLVVGCQVMCEMLEEGRLAGAGWPVKLNRLSRPECSERSVHLLPPAGQLSRSSTAQVDRLPALPHQRSLTRRRHVHDAAVGNVVLDDVVADRNLSADFARDGCAHAATGRRLCHGPFLASPPPEVFCTFDLSPSFRAS